MNPWYLYFWEQADKYELLAATVTELTSAVGAVDANSVPTVVATYSILNALTLTLTLADAVR
jgi:hypothetical protein